jgi:GTP cyclohydrolase IA
MVNTNSSFHPPINGAVVLPGIDATQEQPEPRSSVQALRLVATNPPHFLAPVVADQHKLAAVDSEDLIREILRRVGDDPDREGLQQTPARIMRSWKEIYGGYQQRSEEVLVTQFQAEQYDEMVLLQDIEFYSTCEHHMLPFYGKAHIGYLPNQRIVGLSKLARLLDIYARRLQVQERLTYQIATELQRVLKPKGVAVMMEARHQCMCCRGVRKQEGKMVTSCMLGAFRKSLATRREFLALVRR